jgi:hypothetical protein
MQAGARQGNRNPATGSKRPISIDHGEMSGLMGHAHKKGKIGLLAHLTIRTP